jgi:hypothetical protein
MPKACKYLQIWLLALGLMVGMGLPLRGQTGPEVPDEVKPRQLAIGLGVGIHRFGLGFEAQLTHRYHDRWMRHYGLSLASYKDPHETRIESFYKDQGGKDFIFDKSNYCYVMGFVAGIERELLPRTEHSRLSFNVGAAAGPNFAFLKPYFVEIAVPITPTQAVVEVQRYDSRQLDFTDIVGEADYFTGFGEMQVQVGGKVRVFGTLNLAGSSLYVRAIQFGFQADAFFNRLPIMDQTRNRAVFWGGWVSFLLGNAW